MWNRKMTQSADPGRQAALEDLEAERRRQVAQRVTVTRATHVMRRETGGSGPCLDGTNGWLRVHDVPPVPSRNDQLDEQAAETAALEFIRLPLNGDVQQLSVYQLADALAVLRESGREWLDRIITDLEDVINPDSGYYEEDIPDGYVTALIRQLRGEAPGGGALAPMRAAELVTAREEADSGSGNLTCVVSTELRAEIAITASVRLSVHLDALPSGTSDEQIRQYAVSQACAVLTQAVNAAPGLLDSEVTADAVVTRQ